jgi:hypothetical protein
VLGKMIREMFDQRWTAIVTAELGFANLQEMQAFRAEELREQAGARKGKGGGSGAGPRRQKDDTAAGS